MPVDFATFVFVVVGVVEHPVVKPKAASAEVNNDNLNKVDAVGCHTIVVGLNIRVPNNI